MSLSNPNPPVPQNPTAVADAQQQYNVNAQAGSNVNQVNPYGTLTYKQTGTGPGGVPLYTATTQLSPAQQQLLDQLQGTQATAGAGAGKLLAGANYGGTDPTTAIGNAQGGLVQTALSQYTGALQPVWKQQIDQLDNQLRNQGLAPGSPAYEQAMNGLRQSQNQSTTSFLATEEPAAFQQATQEYTMPATMAMQLAQFGQPGSVIQNLAPTNALKPADYTTATANYNQAQQATYQSQLQQQQAMMSGLFGVGAAGLGGWARAGFPGASSIGSALAIA